MLGLLCKVFRQPLVGHGILCYIRGVFYRTQKVHSVGSLFSMFYNHLIVRIVSGLWAYGSKLGCLCRVFVQFLDER